MGKNIKNKLIGDWGEGVVCEYLMQKGFDIVGRNIKTSYLEIDILAKYLSELIFIEVKTKMNGIGFSVEDMITKKKLENLKRAAQCYIKTNKKQKLSLRIDFVGLEVDKNKKIVKIKHYKNVV